MHYISEQQVVVMLIAICLCLFLILKPVLSSTVYGVSDKQSMGVLPLAKSNCTLFRLNYDYLTSSPPTTTLPPLPPTATPMTSSPSFSFSGQNVNFSNVDVPPLLLTFPGSGNTWVRLLIEVLTGKGSSSLHPDDTLEKVFRLQNSCNSSVSVIKAHPHGLVRDATNDFFSPLYKQLIRRCGTGGYDHFEKVIFINRNVIEASWANFHLSLSGSHTNNFKNFPESRYRQWEKIVLEGVTQLENDWNNKIYPFILKHPTYFHSIHFENLKSPTRQAGELKKVSQLNSDYILNAIYTCPFIFVLVLT